MQHNFPFSALVGQEAMKRALLLNVIDPTLGGVLIKGERGTAKSTGVRALVELLPTIRVVENCPFQCDPDDLANLCTACKNMQESGKKLPVKVRQIRMVNLPIGATEDRLLGTIDIEKAVRSGSKAFEPGLLAEAHRGILYVDEVNLLNDQIVDLFLDAAASGVNCVEREGISFAHASRFILVGTMNPEEGDLRPQLLDRFGLSVNIEGIQSLPERVEIIKRRLAFEQNPEEFRKVWQAADADLAQRVVKGQKALAQIVFPENLLQSAASLSVAMGTDGHRADITMIKAARANAAFDGRDKVSTEDLQLAARLALPHRTKKTPLQKPELTEKKLQEVIDQYTSVNSSEQEWAPIHQNKNKPSATVKTYQSPVECVTHLCSGARTLRPQLPWRLVLGTHPGRRVALPNPQRGGTILGSRMLKNGEKPDDLSLIATLRAAAPYQDYRGRNGILKVLEDDLRMRKRSRKTGLALMMIVDSSASMRTNDRMSVTKGIIGALISDLYLHRDKLGMITFRHTGADLLLPLSSNLRHAAESIENLPVGGRTPLAAGLELGIRLLIQEKRKNPETIPTILVFSDGRPNVSCFGGDPLEETLFYASEVKRHEIQAILVDTEFNPMAVGYGYEIAARMAGAYLTMDRLYRQQ